MTFPGLLIFLPLKTPPNTPMGPLWGGVGKFCLAQNESRIYPNMCAKFGCGPTVVSKKRGGVQTDSRQTKKTAALYSRCVYDVNFAQMTMNTVD